MQVPSDSAAGIETTEEFKQFSQKNDVFTRAFWDPMVRTKKTDSFFEKNQLGTTLNAHISLSVVKFRVGGSSASSLFPQNEI